MSERIIWQAEGVEMPPLDFALMEEWIGKVASSHHREVGSLSYIFCNDPYILEVNRNFLQHDYFTDIITFDYCRGNFLRGDMVISLDTVSSNAMTLGLNPQTELYRVIIHGVLHLCGINDKGPGEREIMERHENDALDILSAIMKKKQTQVEVNIKDNLI
ncbi:MAG: rRNA maturation RNase YbeY [Bacteroidales bacterium]|nr:rRNA maturation RNase YbeY [Bacteroidales bacterium]